MSSSGFPIAIENLPAELVEAARKRALQDAVRVVQFLEPLLERIVKRTDNVSGNTLTRPGLSALLQRIEHDREISVLFIPRRDRLSRPDDPTQGVELENTLRRSGITIQYQDKILRPLLTGQRAEIGEQILSLIDFDQSGKFRRDHASKMVYAKNNLAKQGFSTGGRPPFFLDRWLSIRRENLYENWKRAKSSVCVDTTWLGYQGPVRMSNWQFALSRWQKICRSHEWPAN